MYLYVTVLSSLLHLLGQVARTGMRNVYSSVSSLNTLLSHPTRESCHRVLKYMLWSYNKCPRMNPCRCICCVSADMMIVLHHDHYAYDVRHTELERYYYDYFMVLVVQHTYSTCNICDSTGEISSYKTFSSSSFMSVIKL